MVLRRYPPFEIPHYSLNNALEIGPYILFGLISGVLAVGFVKLLYSLEDAADRLPVKDWIKTPLILFILGTAIIWVPRCTVSVTIPSHRC